MTAPTLARPRPPVEHLDGDGWLVKGDMPEAAARRWVLEGMLLYDGGESFYAGQVIHDAYGLMGCHVQAHDGTYVAVNGWHRKQPCLCGDGHAWDVMPAAGPGPGAFKAWVFTHRAHV